MPLLGGAVIGGLAVWGLLRSTGWGRFVGLLWALPGGLGAAYMFALPSLEPDSFISAFDTARATLPWISGLAMIGSVGVLSLLVRDQRVTQ